MSSSVDELQERVLRLQVNLYACRERLVAGTDDEALHDMRIALRKLRSLLRPLRGVAACEGLLARAAEVGRLSGPLRDLEVLLACLQELGAPDGGRHERLHKGYGDLLASAHMRALLLAFDEWPARWREAAAGGELSGLRKRIARVLHKQQRRLVSALRDPAHDRHRLRLLIKRMRYGAEAYPRQARLATATVAALKQAQSALGDWHDHLQWLARAQLEPDLSPWVDRWRSGLQRAEADADAALLALSDELAGERSDPPFSRDF